MLNKTPEVTLTFWVIKIFATTLGETGGDAVSMSMNLGYAASSVIFIGIFMVAVAAQIAANRFYPLLYWFVILATTTAGTTQRPRRENFGIAAMTFTPRRAARASRGGYATGVPLFIVHGAAVVSL